MFGSYRIVSSIVFSGGAVRRGLVSQCNNALMIMERPIGSGQLQHAGKI